MLVVVGCPRSGTYFTSRLFTEHGLDVAHERWGRDGMSCWMLAGDTEFWRRADACPPELRSAFAVVHQVRHPLKVIGSLFTIAKVSYALLEKAMPFVTTCPVRRAMLAWLHWNRLAQSRASYTYRVENMEMEFDELCRRARFRAALKTDFVTSKQANSRVHREVTWEELDTVDAALAAEIKAQAVGYGYAL